jgi:hypothetical protein
MATVLREDVTGFARVILRCNVVQDGRKRVLM